MKKGEPTEFELDEEQVKSFRTLIDAILSPKVLALPKRDLPFSLDTDACDYGIGCALFQIHPDGERKPIGFWSRSLNSAEKNYDASERECLAVVWALRTLRPYLIYEKFTVHTDHSALQWLFSIEDPSGRLMRWRLRLAEYNFELAYKKGTLNQQADALSRLVTLSETIHEGDNDVPAFLLEEANQVGTEPDSGPKHDVLCHCDQCTDSNNTETEQVLDLSDDRADEIYAALPEPTQSDPSFTPITEEELVTSQFSDQFCSAVRRQLGKGVVLSFFDNEDSILCRRSPYGDQIVVPHNLKQKVLHIYHYSRLAAHPGGRKMYHSIRRSMYWPSLAIDCYATVKKCPTSAKNRLKLRRNVSTLKLFPAQAPLESVAIDIFGELMKTKRGNKYLLVITDRFSKLTKTVPLSGVSASDVAKAFVYEWALVYGPPKELLSDNGTCFTARFFQDVCRILNVENMFTTTYHPQTNGQTECFNRTLKAAIKSYLDDHPRDWDLYAPILTYAYNCQPHTTTSLAPFELVLSRPPPVLAVPSRSRIRAKNAPEALTQWRTVLRKSIRDAKAEMKKNQDRYKRKFDKRLRKQNENIVTGDSVFVRREIRDDNLTRHKFAPLADGPFKVVKSDNRVVTIERPDGTVERMSRDRVTIAPPVQEPDEIADKLRPMTDEELIPKEYPVSEDQNLRLVPKPKGNEERQESAPITGTENESDLPNEEK